MVNKARKYILFLFLKGFCLFSLFLSGRLNAEERASAVAPRVEMEYIPASQRESDKEIIGDESHAKHLIRLYGFPPGEDLTLAIDRYYVGEPDPLFSEESFRIDKNGIIEGFEKKRPYIVISSCGFLPGERIGLSIRSADDSIHHKFSLIPHPMYAKSSDGTLVLEAELASLVYNTYTIRIKGFKKGEGYIFESRTGSKLIKENRICYQNESHETVALKVVGQKGGIGTVIIRDEMCSREVMMKLPWGDRLAPYLIGKTYYPD